MTTTLGGFPLVLNAETNIYTAWDLRLIGEANPQAPGVADRGSFKVLQRQAGATMSVDIGATGAGGMAAWVRGSTRNMQGLYRVDNRDRSQPTTDAYQSQINEVVSAADPTNPRIDQVIIEALDQQHTGNTNLAQTRVVVGTATGGATLDNRAGAASLPTSAILLADVLVPAASSSVVTANIRDRRAFPLRGTIPPTLTDVDAVAFEVGPGLDTASMLIQTTAAADAQQAAALMYLPRAIVGATKIKLRTQQGATANTANSTIAIFDASMRLIVAATTPAAFGGTANQVASPVFAIPATTFEAGNYYVMIGNAAGTASGSVLSFAAGAGAGVGFVSNAPNQYLFSATGGTTVPTTLLAFTDAFGVATGAAVVHLGVPLVALSV